MPMNKRARTIAVLLLAILLGVGALARTEYVSGQTAEIQEKVSTALQRQRLEGAWRPAFTYVDDVSRYPFTHQKLVFKGDTFEQTDGNTVMRGTYEIDSTKNPMWMDWNVTEPKDARAKVKQVYEIKEGKLRIVTGKDGRPTDLKTGNGRRVLICERQQTTEQLLDLLAMPIEVKDFTMPMSFKECLGLLWEKCAGRGKMLPLVVDTRAFRADDPSAPSLFDTRIEFPGSPAKRSISSMLRHALSLLPVGEPMLIRRGTVLEIAGRGEPALIIRDGEIVITTRAAVSKGSR